MLRGATRSITVVPYAERDSERALHHQLFYVIIEQQLERDHGLRVGRRDIQTTLRDGVTNSACNDQSTETEKNIILGYILYRKVCQQRARHSKLIGGTTTLEKPFSSKVMMRFLRELIGE